VNETANEGIEEGNKKQRRSNLSTNGLELNLRSFYFNASNSYLN
jgi:hypothetical protein